MPIGYTGSGGGVPPGGNTGQVLAKTSNLDGEATWIDGGGGVGIGVVIYATVQDLPVSADPGQLAFITSTNNIYLWNGSIWFLVLTANTPNTAPYITQGPLGGYLLATDGTPTVITVAAQDPEGVPITWDYAITSGNIGTIATIDQLENVFTITPSTTPSDAGSFELTITASDGVSFASAKTYIRLRFAVEDYGFGLVITNSLAAPSFSSTASAKFGRSVAAHGGVVAVAGAARTVTNLADSAANRVYVYTSVTGGALVLLDEIDNPANTTQFGENNIVVYGDMILVPGNRDTGGVISRCIFVYFRTGNTWELSQTIDFEGVSATNSAVGPQPLAVSNSGLIMCCASPYSVSSSGFVEARIYSRASTATTTWTLRQTLSGEISFGSNDLDNFPEHISISTTGKHIFFGSVVADAAIANAGRVIGFTNSLLPSSQFSWTKTYDYNPGVTSLVGLGISNTTKSDDLFYVFSSRGVQTDSTLQAVKFSDATQTWTVYPYNQLGPFTLGQLAHGYLNKNQFMAIPGRTGTTEVLFVSVRSDPQDSTKSHMVVIRAAHYDITITNPVGTNNGYVNNGDSWWCTPMQIPNSGNLTTANLYPYITLDDLTGNVYLGHRGDYTGSTLSGAVFQYTPSANTSFIQGYHKTLYGQAGSTATFSFTVPEDTYFLHGVCVGGGGFSGNDTSNGAAGGGGGGGGGLRWITNYPVVPGDTVLLTAGASGIDSTIKLNGVDILVGGGGFSGGNGTGVGGAGGEGSTRGTFVANQTTYYIGGGNGGGGGGGGVMAGSGSWAVGGGGAGGYSGNGGGGQTNSSGLNAGSGVGGGGGGGSGSNESGSQRYKGGGVGLYGIGSNGSAALGRAGADGSMDTGLNFDAVIGTGGGAAGTGEANTGSGTSGSGGGVRVMLGDRYTFGNSGPNTAVFLRPYTYTGQGT